MPKFMTISPTHIPGKKEYAWNNFKRDGYIAIGWMNKDLTGKNLDEILEIIMEHEYPNEASAIETFKKFIEFKIGDIVAVNNVNHGLFGVGEITSEYYYNENKHDYGGDENDGYSHLRNVNWLYSNYVRRNDLVSSEETGWSPYGTVGAIYEELPPYIKRLLKNEIPTPNSSEELIETPSELNDVISNIKKLRNDSNHLERAHESLVEDFLVALGYEKHLHIKYRKNRIDISVWEDGNPLILFEVKRDWDISTFSHPDAIKQAYNYALEYGIRYVVVTNGEDYILYDRLKGLSIKSNLIGYFRITSLQKDDLELIDRLRYKTITLPNLEELFKNISEAFQRTEIN